MANPNPSPDTRFGAKNGNPSGSGKTKKQKQAETRAAEIAALLREKMLSEMLEKVNAGESAFDLMDANSLKLFKDSEDRAHGTPKATTEIGGAGGGPVLVTEVAYKVVEPGRED